MHKSKSKLLIHTTTIV